MEILEQSSPLKRRQICLTKNLPKQNQYTLALENEFSAYAFSEERAPSHKGQWREKVFSADGSTTLDLEIGTGIGKHFSHYVKSNPDRLVLGIEIKYKPLIQTIRKTLLQGSKNAAVIRYHAFNIEELFAENELDKIIIHFPDPWTSPRKPKNRVMRREMLNLFYRLQKASSVIEFKTDSLEYFEWALEEVPHSKYKLEFATRDLHQSERKDQNFVTTFESIFLKKGQPIYAFWLSK